MALTSPGVIKTTNDILVKLAPKLTFVRPFVYDISSAVADYGDKIRVAMVSGGSAESYNADTSNYEHETGALSDVFVTLDSQPKSTIGITQMERLELPNDSFWSRFSEAGAQSISKAISEKVCGLLTAAACTGGKVVLGGSFTLTDLAGLGASCAGRKGDTVLVLDAAYYDRMLGLLPANTYGSDEAIRNGTVGGFYGFRAVVRGEDLPAGIKGALVPATGIACAVRPVAIPDISAYPEADIVSDENGFSITATRHTAFSTGKAYFNTTCLVGAVLTQPDKTKYLAAS